MLDALNGRLVRADDDFAVVNVNGLHFRVDISASTAQRLPAVGESVVILTRLGFNPNEGTFSLFGFGDQTERDCFDILTSISGIGARKALAILSQIEVASFAKAVITNDLTYLSKIKGVGRKTAERLVVELREKMVPYTKAESSETSLPVAENVKDAVEALIVLGCRQAVAEKAIGEAIKELGQTAKTEDLIRVGLRFR